MVDEARRTSFDRRAELYDEVRPSYPREVADAVLADVPDGGRLLEIGAGTGKATRWFAPHRAVTALEPGEHLAAVLRRNAPEARVVETTFEAWEPDGVYDVVYAAQSIHWIAPEVRYVKAARVARAIAVIRNEKGAMERADLDAIYARWFGAAKPDSVGHARDEIVGEIAASGAFGPATVGSWAWSERYATARYLALLDTYSDHAVLAADVRTGLYADVADAIERRGGAIDIAYVTLLIRARSAFA
jgi:SAM-dependent methyltransferase